METIHTKNWSGVEISISGCDQLTSNEGIPRICVYILHLVPSKRSSYEAIHLGETGMVEMMVNVSNKAQPQGATPLLPC